MTLHELETQGSVFWSSEKSPSSLTDWYLSIRDVQLNELTIRDLCLALRQDLFSKEITPYAIEALKIDILAGEKYDGELISAIGTLPKAFWKNNPIAKNNTLEILDNAEPSRMDADILRDVSSLLSTLTNSRENQQRP